MAGPPPPPPSSGDDDDIMGTYADAITLLMAFFVLFFSISKVDLDVMDEVAKGMSASIAKETRTTQQEKLTADLKDMIISEGAEEVIKMGTDADGSITLELDAGQFFKPGSADLQEQAVPVLTGMYDELSSELYKNFNITVEGHTDDDPISTLRFPSNWELSTGRAATVVRFLQTAGFSGEGIDGKRLSATPRCPTGISTIIPSQRIRCRTAAWSSGSTGSRSITKSKFRNSGAINPTVLPQRSIRSRLHRIGATSPTPSVPGTKPAILSLLAPGAFF